jgi:hypothetical protein
MKQYNQTYIKKGQRIAGRVEEGKQKHGQQHHCSKVKEKSMRLKDKSKTS